MNRPHVQHDVLGAGLTVKVGRARGTHLCGHALVLAHERAEVVRKRVRLLPQRGALALQRLFRQPQQMPQATFLGSHQALLLLPPAHTI